MSGRPRFRPGARVLLDGVEVEVLRTRFNASGREWVDIRLVRGPHAGLTTTLGAEHLVRRETAAPPVATGGELA
jgi:hypothetical protein